MNHKTHQPHLSTARDARAVRTREALRQAFLTLLEKKPLDAISVRDICAAAGVGYTTFFRHHPSKEACLDDVAAEQIERLIGLALPALDAGGTLPGSVALCSYVAAHRALWASLLTGGAAGTMRDEFLRLSREVAARRRHVANWLPAEVSIAIVSSATVELLVWWLRQPNPHSVAKIAKIHERLVIQLTGKPFPVVANKPPD